MKWNIKNQRTLYSFFTFLSRLLRPSFLVTAITVSFVLLCSTICISIQRTDLRYAYSWKSQFSASLIMFITIVSIDKMFIKPKDVCRVLNASRNTIYALQKRDPSFPQPIKFGDKKQSRVFYRESEINDWILKVSSSNFHVESEK